MKTRNILALAAVMAISLSLLSCIVTSRAINVDISCQQFSENPNSMRNEFEVEVGDKITVKLCSNPTTGFEWGYEITGDDVIMEEDHDFEEPEDGAVGVAGTEVWTFEATETGEAEVHMEYSRPWEEEEQAEWTYFFTVTVE